MPECKNQGLLKTPFANNKHTLIRWPDWPMSIDSILPCFALCLGCPLFLPLMGISPFMPILKGLLKVNLFHDLYWGPHTLHNSALALIEPSLFFYSTTDHLVFMHIFPIEVPYSPNPFFGGIGDWTQGLTLPRQPLYHLSHAPVLLFFRYCLLLLSQPASDHVSSTSISSVAGITNMYYTKPKSPLFERTGVTCHL
jgi:hypothetical protein